MKSRVFIIAVLTVGMAALFGSPVLALHDDGVAHCNACHTMHNSQNGVALNGSDVDINGDPINGLPVGQGYPDLLLFPNKTDVCLRCHDGEGSYHVWSADPTVPGGEGRNKGAGDFVFLEEDNINDAHAGASNPVLGHAAGHSVISGIKGTVADPVLALSPGGAYPGADLACSSCHDPHGTDAFRLTYRDGQSTTSDSGHVINWTATMTGTAINVFGGIESDSNHNAYNSDYSAWCGECHGDFHAASANLVHPAGEIMDSDQVAVYNAYRGTTDCVNNPPSGGAPCGSGTSVDAFTYVVPFVDPDIVSTSSAQGPDATNSRVACVSCHRAHATSAMDAGRWDFNVTGMVEDGHESSSFEIPMPVPYDDVFQRSMCNKCHSRDEYDALLDFTP
ncbi:MAG: hypothetical protein OEM39_08860 [Acidimicrobiia bacterium]|nr:hypothetical protein [Acidimicrobiia bacterium]